MIPLEPYELTQMLHFVNKLGLLIDNCPRDARSEYTDLRVSVPLIQTKDAIEQLKSHLDKLVEIGKNIEDTRRKEEELRTQELAPGSVDTIC